ncbi:MAG TPA: hypothetical protein VF447_13770 [Terriglobales bacterium]
MKRIDDWTARLGVSLLFGGGSVVGSFIGELLLNSFPWSKTAELASYVIGIPLLPGIGFVSMFHNSWQAFHQGQIALVPIVSLPTNVLIIFGVWTLLKRRRSSPAEKHITLGITH